jgi:hypothetical protein
MTGARVVSAALTIFAILCFSCTRTILAAGPEDSLASVGKGSITTTKDGRTFGGQWLLTNMLAACIATSVADRYSGERLGAIRGQQPAAIIGIRNSLRLRGKHPSSGRQLHHQEEPPQISDAYSPAYASHLMLLHYPVWFQLCPRDAFTNHT